MEAAMAIYLLLFIACGMLIHLRPFIARFKPSPTSITSLPPSFLSSQRRFACMHFAVSAVEQLQVIFAEVVCTSIEVERKRWPMVLAVGFTSSFLFGTLLGLSTEFLGKKRTSVTCLLLHVLVAVCMQAKSYQMLYFAASVLGPIMSVFPCVFESWIVADHEKSGFAQDWLNDTFWLMTFGSPVVTIATVVVANALDEVLDLGVISLTAIAAVAAGVCAFLMAQHWKDPRGCQETTWLLSISIPINSLQDKKILLLGLIHVCLELSMWTFWFLWMPTLVADGREVNGSQIFLILMASRLLGSTISCYLLGGPFLTSPEVYMPITLVVLSLCMAVPAYDYQEVSDLIAVFSLFQMGVGIALPSLAHLRNIYIQTDRRAGIMAVYRAPTNVALTVVLIYGAKYHYLENSMIFTLCAFSLLCAAAGLYVLGQWKVKPPGQYSLKKP